MKGNKLKGEITIETAIVFPIVMLMVLLLIYFSMFLHDIVNEKLCLWSRMHICRNGI